MVGFSLVSPTIEVQAYDTASGADNITDQKDVSEAGDRKPRGSLKQASGSTRKSLLEDGSVTGNDSECDSGELLLDPEAVCAFVQQESRGRVG